MYLTYTEYTDMGGTLDPISFNDFEFEAEAIVNWYTFNRLKNDTVIPREVKMVVNHLISVAEKQAKLLTSSTNSNSVASVASQSNDGVSISYNVLSASELMRNFKTSEKNIINKYLQGVTNELGQKLLYRGLYPGE